MKNLLIVMTMIFITGECAAQFFAQKKTKRELLLQQIAALQVYTGYLQKGYTIVKSGVNMISNIKNGDFNLHSDFFNSLKHVNPAISNYSKVAEMITFQNSIVSICNQMNRSISTETNFTNDEKQYLKNVSDRLLSLSFETMNELSLATSNDSLEMKDDERIQWIDKLYSDIRDKYVFINSFSKQFQVVSLQRTKEQSDINTSGKLYGIK